MSQKYNKNLQQGLDWLKKEAEKDQKAILNHKRRMIEEIKKIDKSKIFEEPKKEKINIFTKILMVFGYGKKG